MSAKTIIPSGRPERIVRFFGAVDSATVLSTIEAMLSFDNDGHDPVVLHLSSPGGCVSSGLSLIDTMRHKRGVVSGSAKSRNGRPDLPPLLQH